MEIEELVKVLIFVVVLIIMVGAAILLLYGKGGDILNSINNILRFGS